MIMDLTPEAASKPMPHAATVVQLDRVVLRKQRLIAGFEPCPYVDAYKVLRTRIIQKLRDKGWNTLAVTSPNPKAGNTVAAINLALSIASEFNQSALLVDSNLRSPSVHEHLGLNPKYGLADHLLDHVELDKILLQPNGLGDLLILPGHRPMLNSSEMMSSPQMAQLVSRLKTQDPSRFVIFDLPDLHTSDALAFLPLVDAVLLVIEAGATTDANLSNAAERLHGVPLVGTLLNKAEISH